MSLSKISLSPLSIDEIELRYLSENETITAMKYAIVFSCTLPVKIAEEIAADVGFNSGGSFSPDLLCDFAKKGCIICYTRRKDASLSRVVGYITVDAVNDIFIWIHPSHLHTDVRERLISAFSHKVLATKVSFEIAHLLTEK